MANLASTFWNQEAVEGGGGAVCANDRDERGGAGAGVWTPRRQALIERRESEMNLIITTTRANCNHVNMYPFTGLVASRSAF